MNNNSTYHSWCSYALSLLMFWISTGQVLGWGNCSCASHTAPTSCCAKSNSSDKRTRISYKQGVQIQNAPCCCQQLEEQAAFSPLGQVLELAVSYSFLPITLVQLVIASCLFSDGVYIASPAWSYYAPPLLCKDIPIFVQSFLL
ncbi:MAG: hypothetical protein AB8E82_04890 [Aureispira sp.]